MWLRPRLSRSCSTISAARKAAKGLEQPGLAELVEAVKAGKAYVKISGAYRAVEQAPDYPDVCRWRGR